MNADFDNLLRPEIIHILCLKTEEMNARLSPSDVKAVILALKWMAEKLAEQKGSKHAS